LNYQTFEEMFHVEHRLMHDDVGMRPVRHRQEL